MACITIVVPVYNVIDYLERCLDSIVAQTYKKYDVIAIDDGSTDGCGELCDEYAGQYAHIHVIHQKNSGLSAARNAGIEWALQYSDSQYLSFIDSDDWIHPQYLEWLYSAIQTEGCAIAIGKFMKISADSCKFEWGIPHVTTVQLFDFYCDHSTNFTVTWGKLYHKVDFAKIRFPEGKLHEDEFTVWKVLFRYDRAAFIDIPIYAYYQRNDSIIHSPWRMERTVCLDALNEQKKWIDQHGNERLKQKIRYKLADECARQIRGMESIGMDAHTIRVWRKKLKGYIRDARDVLGFVDNYVIYRSAWPLISRILILLYRISKKFLNQIYFKG